jgi:hypothetical protein
MARSLLLSASASVVFPEPGKPHTTINLPAICTVENYRPATRLRAGERRAIALRTGVQSRYVEAGGPNHVVSASASPS